MEQRTWIWTVLNAAILGGTVAVLWQARRERNLATALLQEQLARQEATLRRIPAEPERGPQVLPPVPDVVPAAESPVPGPQVLPAPPEAESETVESEDLKRVPALQNRILNTSLTAEERLKALRELRMAAPKKRTLEIVRRVLEMLPTVDEAMQADLVRNLKGLKYDEMKVPLVEMLQRSQNPQIRRQAAETLASLKEDLWVKQALEGSAATDADENVRLQATKSLAE